MKKVLIVEQHLVNFKRVFAYPSKALQSAIIGGGGGIQHLETNQSNSFKYSEWLLAFVDLSPYFLETSVIDREIIYMIRLAD